jgi:hypothetical protein
LLEVALLSQHNIKKAVALELQKVIVSILLNIESTEESMIHSQMCLSKMLAYKDANIVVNMIGTPYFAHWLATCLDTLPADVTVYPSTFRILRKSFESLAVSELLFKNNPNIANSLIRITKFTKDYPNVLLANLEVRFTNPIQIAEFKDSVSLS